jgi:hypothetical protein
MVYAMKTNQIEFDTLWTGLSCGERRLICALMRMLRGAKRSQIADVARAAAKWESGISCFIKVRLTHQKPRRLLPNTGWIKVERSPDGETSNSNLEIPDKLQISQPSKHR